MLYLAQLTSLLMITLIKGVAESSPCSDLVLDPPELVVRYGDPVSVSCRSLSEYTELGWDVPLGSVSQLDNQTVIWETDNLTDWEIEPMCYMIQNGENCNKTLPLTVYKLPDQVSFSIVNHTGPMIEGRKYELQCEVHNFAPVYVLAAFWYKGDTLLKNRGFAELFTKTPSNKTVSHKITAGRDKGEAQYWCEAKLKLGSAGPQPSPTIKSNLLSVTVHYKPVIEPCSDWTPMINTPLNAYPSDITGNPTPSITWYRDKSPVSSEMILTRNDSGTYQLLAVNMMGKASCVRSITVEYVPTFNCPPSYVGREHDSFLGKCSVMASPKADIIWEKDGTTVNPLHHLRRGDSGSYVITAVNKHGAEKHKLTIDVLYGPEIKQNTSSEAVTEGEDVSLSCTAEGNPEPEVTWSFQSQTKATGRRQTTLTVSKATPADGGVYTCTATNDLGTVTRNVSLQVKSNCSVKIRPGELVVEFGALASANCSTVATHQGLGWESSQGPVDLTANVQFLIWRVEHLTHWDIRPICFIIVKDKHCTLELPVTVYKRPDQVSVSAADHTGPMTEGMEYVLLCDVQNVAPIRLLTVTWYKGPNLVKRESFPDESKFPVNKNATLQISPNKSDDGIQYRCEAKLNLGPEGPPVVTSQPLNITVHYKPQENCLDWSPLINTTLNSYPHKFAGNPTPQISWYRNGSLVSSDMTLSRKDSGRYTLFAINPMGNASCVINIKTEYAPTFNCPSSYVGREHDLFLGQCSVMASPEADISWEKDGKNVMSLHRLTKEDSGLYVITARNKHGAEKHTLTINVQYGPKIQETKPTEAVNAGKDVSLHCTADGNPEPEVKWSFQNQTRASGKRRSTLNIDQAKSADAGQYTCTATNGLGSDTRKVSLTVHESKVLLIILVLGFILILVILIIYVICKCIQRRRSGQYNVQANGAVTIPLVQRTDGTGNS